MSSRQQTTSLVADLRFASSQVLADQIVEFRRPQGPLKGLSAAQRPVEAIGAEQVFVVENNVVDSDDLVFAQLQVIQPRTGLMHVHAERKMGVMVEISAGA